MEFTRHGRIDKKQTIMLVFILISILLIGSHILCYYANKKLEFTAWDYVGIITVIINTVLWIFLIFAIVCVQMDAPITVARYDNLKEQVEVYNSDPEHSSVEAYSLREDVLKMNNEITDCRTYCDNLWLNWYFPKKLQILKKFN